MVESPLVNENGINCTFRESTSESQGTSTESDTVLGAVPGTGHRVSGTRRAGTVGAPLPKLTADSQST